MGPAEKEAPLLTVLGVRHTSGPTWVFNPIPMGPWILPWKNGREKLKCLLWELTLATLPQHVGWQTPIGSWVQFPLPLHYKMLLSFHKLKEARLEGTFLKETGLFGGITCSSLVPISFSVSHVCCSQSSAPSKHGSNYSFKGKFSCPVGHCDNKSEN